MFGAEESDTLVRGRILTRDGLWSSLGVVLGYMGPQCVAYPSRRHSVVGQQTHPGWVGCLYRNAPLRRERGPFAIPILPHLEERTRFRLCPVVFSGRLALCNVSGYTRRIVTVLAPGLPEGKAPNAATGLSCVSLIGVDCRASSGFSECYGRHRGGLYASETRLTRALPRLSFLRPEHRGSPAGLAIRLFRSPTRGFSRRYRRFASFRWMREGVISFRLTLLGLT